MHVERYLIDFDSTSQQLSIKDNGLVLVKQTCRKSLTKDILVTMVALMNPQAALDCLSLNILRNI